VLKKVRKFSYRHLGWLVSALDVLIAILSALLAYDLTRGSIDSMPDQYRLLIAICAVTLPAWFSQFGVYKNEHGNLLKHKLSRVLLAWIMLWGTMAALALMTKTGARFSRLWMGYTFMISLMGFLTTRIVLQIVINSLRKQGHNLRNILLIGTANAVANVQSALEKHPTAGFNVTTRIVLDSNELECVNVSKEVSQLVGNKNIDQVWIAASIDAPEIIKEVLRICSAFSIQVTWIPDVFSGLLVRQTISSIAGMSAVVIQEEALSTHQEIIKLVEDKLLSGAICIVASPLFLLLTMAIRLSSPGPAIYRQLRHGRNGEIIKVYKFRTMYLHQDAPGPIQLASADDPRITPVGKFLRRTSLDELPQFINVIQGNMSIVGPRPHPVSLEDEYAANSVSYHRRQRVKPGITGWAQINGFRGLTDTSEKIRGRVEHDLYYIDNWSLWLDFKIILMTAIRGWAND